MGETSLLENCTTERKSPVCKSKLAYAYYGISGSQRSLLPCYERSARLEVGIHVSSEDLIIKSANNAVHHLDSRWLVSTVWSTGTSSIKRSPSLLFHNVQPTAI